VKLNRVVTAALTILLFTLLASVTLSQQGTAPATTSKLLELKIQAPSLKGNLLGDHGSLIRHRMETVAVFQ